MNVCTALPTILKLDDPILLHGSRLDRRLLAQAESKLTLRRVRRTSPIASVFVATNLHDIDSSRTSVTNTSQTKIGRGKRFGLKDSSLAPVPQSWKVKEHHSTFLQKDRMPSFTTAMKGLEEKSDMTNQKLDALDLSLNSRARLYPIHASLPLQANVDKQAIVLNERTISGRLKRTKTKTKATTRFLPYPSFCNLNARPRHQYLMPTVQTRHIGRKSSLETALFGSPSVLQPKQVAWFILIVAVDYRGLQDPVHDLGFWRNVLGDPALESEIIYFIELVGEEATPENINKNLTEMYHDSESLGKIGPSNLFVYLTGEGDEQNRMRLLDGKFISEDDIDRWLAELHKSCGYTRPIILALDICRVNADKPSARMHHGINLICSASPGEKAKAIRFQSNQPMPYSCFVLAFITASKSSSTSTNDDFKADIERRLKQLIGLMDSAPSKRISGESNDGPGPQVPDWSQANVSDHN
ncbi:hypothetical protein RHS02_07133, partial [Rhizoctonia solani]